MSQTDLVYYETGANEDDKASDTYSLWMCMGKIVNEMDEEVDATHFLLGPNRYLQYSSYQMSTIQMEGDDVEFEDNFVPWKFIEGHITKRFKRAFENRETTGMKPFLVKQRLFRKHHNCNSCPPPYKVLASTTVLPIGL